MTGWCGWATLAVCELSAAAAESFHKLGEQEIRTRIIGRIITDDAHWWDHYRADGRIDSSDMGRRTIGRWQIKKGQLCIWRGSLDGECYDVWVAGGEIQLRSEGLKLFPAYIRRVDRR